MNDKKKHTKKFIGEHFHITPASENNAIYNCIIQKLKCLANSSYNWNMNKFTNNFNERLEPQFSSANSNPSGWGRNEKLSYCEFMQKNKPQSNSVAGG